LDIAAAAPLSVQASKAAISAQASGLQQDFEQAATRAALTFDSLDYAEGRRAFMEKRRAGFSGE